MIELPHQADEILVGLVGAKGQDTMTPAGGRQETQWEFWRSLYYR